MKHPYCQSALFFVLTFSVLNCSTRAATPEENRVFLVETFTTLSDVSAYHVFFLQLLAEGKTYDEATTAEDSDPDTLATYESLTPDARRKLAVNFAGKIKNAEALETLAGKIAKEGGRPALSPEDARKAILAGLGTLSDMPAGELLVLKGLADAKSWDEAMLGKSDDPETLNHYKSLTSDARLKLALDFAGKIKDPYALNKLARELAEDTVSPKAAEMAKAPIETSDLNKAVRDVLSDAIKFLPDLGDNPPETCARALLVIKALSEGKAMADARAVDDPETLRTYTAMTPDARKKMAVNFADKIADSGALLELAKQYTEMAVAFKKK